MNSILNHFNLKSGKNVLFFRGAFLISILIIILLGFTLWAESFDLDRRFSAQFYSFDEDWHLAEFAPWSWFYDYGANLTPMLFLEKFKKKSSDSPS